MIRYLSYPIQRKNPVYGRADVSIDIFPTKSISMGESCNVFAFTIENHWGTHVDCPAHFFEDGRKVIDYTAESWLFEKPFVLPIVLKENQIIKPEDFGLIPEGADLILMQSGFGGLRGTERYSNNNPGFSPETGIWLRKKYPGVRAVGFDFISLSPYQKRDIGREAHRAFLDPQGVNAPVLIIEDMDLSGNLTSLNSVWVAPLLLEGVDSAPCTVIGVLND